MLMAAVCGYATLPTSPYIPDTSAERRPLMHSLLPDLRREEDKEVFLTDIITASTAESVKMFSTRCGAKLRLAR